MTDVKMQELHTRNLLFAFSRFVDGDKEAAVDAFRVTWIAGLLETYLYSFKDEEIYSVLDGSDSGGSHFFDFIKAKKNEERVTKFFLKVINKSVEQWMANKKGSATAS
jgi:hypothetical protein